MEHAGHDRQGAGAYLGKRYRVSTVTANAWLNGDHKCSGERARKIAQDHGCTFDSLYFGPSLVFSDDVKGSTASETPPEMAELQWLLGVTAKALAASIQPAAREIVEQLERPDRAPRKGTFAWDFLKAIRAEIPASGRTHSVSESRGKARQ